LKEVKDAGSTKMGAAFAAAKWSRLVLWVDNFSFFGVFSAVFCALRRARRIGVRLRADSSSCRYRLRFPIFVGEKE
jgi:hypothetical protein